MTKRRPDHSSALAAYYRAAAVRRREIFDFHAEHGTSATTRKYRFSRQFLAKVLKRERERRESEAKKK